MSNSIQRWIVQEMMRPLVMVGSALGKVDELLFGRYHIRSSKKREHQFAQEIRRDLPFLFNEESGATVPDNTVKHPRPFDFASVTVDLDDLRFRFFRGRGDLRAWVAPQHAPNDWEELPLVLRVLDAPEWVESKPFLFWDDLARVLKPRMAHLREALSVARYPELMVSLSDVHKQEQSVIRQWETETNRRLDPDG
jgi:hypothetical protein